MRFGLPFTFDESQQRERELVESYRVIVVRRQVVGAKEIPGFLPSLRPKLVEIVAGQHIGPA